MAQAGREMREKTEPLLLAIETATMCGSVALVGGHCIGEVSLNSTMTHSRRLLSTIELLMQDTGVNWNDIDGLAISLGPGSFTGLRIGLSTAKGLAMAAEKPMVGIGTLDALAAQFAMTRGLICPVLDARKKEVYTGFFRSSGDGTVEKLTDDMAISPAALCGMLKEPVIMVGDGLFVFEEYFQEQLGDLLIKAPAQLYYARASAVAMLGKAKWLNNDFLDPGSSIPTYVRRSEAEVLFKG